MAKKLLIVEDDNDIRSLYNEILTSEGYEVDLASSGVEAISILKITGRLPCLILTDFYDAKHDGRRAHQNPKDG